MKNTPKSKPFSGMTIDLWNGENPVTLVKPHNSGRSADIWLGELNEEKVAVKIYRPKFDDGGIFEQSIEREYKVECEDSRIVSCEKRGIIEYSKERWSYVLVMPFIDGECLTDIIRNNSLKPNQKIVVCKEIIIALLSLHESKIIHGDLNPANIVISKGGTKSNLVDFEFCVPVDDIQNIVDYPGRGTPGYIAPEVEHWGLKAITFSADIWSLGWILAETINKDKLQEERNWKKFREEHGSDVSMLKDWSSDFGEYIDDAIRRCVIINKKERIKLQEIIDVFDKKE